MRMNHPHAALTLALLLSFDCAASAQDADAARRWRLHCIALGGDLSEPAGILLFRRCLAEAPAGAATQDTAPVVNPFAKNPLVVTETPVPLTNTCPEGLAPRGATPDDLLCVPLAVRDRTLRENAVAPSRVVPGSDRCRSGFVWREATKSDHVCVVPATRAEAARDNAAAQN